MCSSDLEISFKCTNNAAEYEALLHGIQITNEMNITRIRCLGDSDLVSQQVTGTWDSKDPGMTAYIRAVTQLAGHFQGYQVDHIDRRLNEAADALARLGSQKKQVRPNVFLDEIHSPSVKIPTEEDIANPDPESELIATIHTIPEWTEPYLAYLSRGELPQEEIIAR